MCIFFLVLKLKPNRISGDLLNILDFLKNKKQRVVLNNDQTSNWENIRTGVLQGSNLRALTQS